MKDSLIVVSGGMDSVTMMYEYAEQIALAVSFDYGSNHNKKEIEFAKLHCERLGIRHLIIPLAFMGQYFKSSLLEGADAIPEGHYTAENMKSTVVPFRNGIMLSIACGLAESNGLKKVLIANHGGDHTIYPDCRPEFINAMSSAMTLGTDTHVEVFAPYTNITKSDIARHGKALNINYAETWSCYKGGDKHCGKCGTCVERKEALAEAGIEDTTEYE
ncbi:MAG: 7-cyano-7-deazaguanine synthase QueC [Bacteroidaceae bacterium]|nr:7-cyano-7-deazaguanine synthase QueC [Bacteroidaceae bacterium]